MLFVAFPSLIAGAALYRLRGAGVFPTQVGRLIWAVATGILCGLLAGPVGLLAAVGAWAGLLIPHGKFYAIGFDTHKDTGYRPIKNMAIMSLIGMVRLGLIALPLAFITPDAMALIVIGGLHGPAYYAGWKLHRKLGQESIAWGEYLTGAYTWTALALILGGVNAS